MTYHLFNEWKNGECISLFIIEYIFPNKTERIINIAIFGFGITFYWHNNHAV